MTAPGLRERKKQQMYATVSEIAVRLFLEKGFDAVSVAEIAAAEISKPTLFRYFPAKEDLVLHRIADHEDEAARLVEQSDQAPLAALRRHFLDGLEREDPVTGLNAHPDVLAGGRCRSDAAAAARECVGGRPRSGQAGSSRGSNWFSS